MSLLDDLRHTLAEQPGQVLFVIGAGVTVGALRGSPSAPQATWPGLLRSGLAHVRQFGRLTDPELSPYQELLELGTTGALLSVADLVQSELKSPPGELSTWLREAVGRFVEDVRDGSVLSTLADFHRRGSLLATTNYDHLLESVTHASPVTWREHAEVERVLRGNTSRILHLHGVWDQPQSVVLSAGSYADVVRDPHAQSVLKTLRMTRTFVFVGCGAGLQDPNMGGFLHWTTGVFAESEYRHIRLCLQNEVEALRREHPPEQRVFPLAYGASHTDLDAFLRALLPSTAPSSSSSLSAELVIYRRALLDRLPPMVPIGMAFSRLSSATLESLFIEPMLRESDDLPPRRRADDPDTDEPPPSPATSSRDWREFLPGPERPGVVLLGGMGSGKSTALRVLARRLCRDADDLPESLHGLIPVWVDLGRFAASLASAAPPADLLDYATRTDPRLAPGTLSTLDDARRLVWILDGLDEVADPLTRGRTLSIIEAFRAAEPPRFVLVASRPDPDPQLSPRFARLSLVPWDEPCVALLVRRFYAVVQPGSESESRAQRVLDALYANSALLELCQTPLFLSLVLSLERGGDIPWPRHRLYRKALDLLLDEWDLSKALVPLAPLQLALDDKLAFLRRFAWTMLEAGRLSLRRDELVSASTGLFREMFGEAPMTAEALASRLVDDLCQRSNLLIPDESGGFAFPHRTWLDYLAALELRRGFNQETNYEHTSRPIGATPGGPRRSCSWSDSSRKTTPQRSFRRSRRSCTRVPR